MKKAAYLLPLVTLLTSCGGFNFRFENSVHSAGIEGNDNTSQKNYTESYTFFSGDVISSEGKSTANITFVSEDGLSNISTEKIDEIIRCDVEGIYAGAIESFNVGTKENAYLFVGAKSSISDGYMTLSFNVAIKDILIEAAPYYYVDNSWNDNELKRDDNVCVAVNSSSYIKLSSSVNDTGDAILVTKCSYHFAETQTQIKIKVGGEKAFIEKITLYY